MFDASVISNVRTSRSGASLILSWSSTIVGVPFQVYVGSRRAWSNYGQSATIQAPPAGTRITIGAVDPSEIGDDFSAYLPPYPRSRASLAWSGGTFEAPDIQGFRIYGERTAGEGINPSGTYGDGTYGDGGYGIASPVLADLEAYADGLVTDGYGFGLYGDGTYGAMPGSYSWESGPYKTGTWTFAVVPYDRVGNLGTSALVSASLTSAPEEVPAFPDYLRLHRTYSTSTHAVTINWQASPG